MNESDNDIEQFWDENPVGSNFIEYNSSRKFYEDYDGFRYSSEGHILDELNQLEFEGKRVLEIGLGQGADSMQIIQRGGIYYGIDLTDESIKRVKERFSIFNQPYKELVKANAQNIPYDDGFFDVVYSHGVIHHSPEIHKIVSEIHRVLKPKGKIVVMLYHKNSFNYRISIVILRRLGLLLILAFPFLLKLVSKVTGEGVNRINGHKRNFRIRGWSYFRLKEFIHKSTDGPDNIYSSVWSKKSSTELFSPFENLEFKVHFLNERHLLGIQKILPKYVKRKLAENYGWHLWVFATK